MPDFGRWTGNGGDPSLNDINRADRFFESLASNQPVYSTDPGEAELAFLLSDWRDEVRDTPVTAVVTPRDAVAALHGGLNARKRTRGPLTLVGSVAAALLCIGGFSAAVYGAGPGDAFYGMRTALFGSQSSPRDDQVALASQQLAQVQQLIDQGDWQQAQDKLVTLSTTVQSIDQVDRKQDLIEQWNALTYKVVEQDPAATLPPPGEPLPPMPSSPLTLLPIPVIADTTTSDTSTSSSETTPPSDVTTTTGTETTSTEPPTTTTEPSTSTSTTTEPSTSTSTSTPTTPTTTPPPPPPTSTVTTTTTSRQPSALPPPSTTLPPTSVSVPSSVSVPPPASAEPPASPPQLVVTTTPPQAPPAVVEPNPPQQDDEQGQTGKSPEEASPPKAEQEVVTTTVAPPGRGGNKPGN